MLPMEKPFDTTKLLLQSHTSTDGSISPQPRWTKGSPPLLEDDAHESVTPGTTSSDTDESPPVSPVLLLHNRKQTHIAWSWLMEDEADTEPRLSAEDTVQMPYLVEAEIEMLRPDIEQRLREVGRDSQDVSALIREYMRFMFLRKQLDGILTLKPSLLVDDAWQVHIASDRAYQAFCKRTFDEGVDVSREEVRLEEEEKTCPLSSVPYKNTLCAYRHFFGSEPPSHSWPVPSDEQPSLEGEGVAVEDSSGRRATLVRLHGERYHFSGDGDGVPGREF